MAMRTASLLCFARGDASGWEAICVDFDIAVQGNSFDAVKALLGEAIASYAADAMCESSDVRARLLSRRAPLHVRLALTAQLIAFNLFRRRRDDARASFPLACPA